MALVQDIANLVNKTVGKQVFPVQDELKFKQQKQEAFNDVLGIADPSVIKQKPSLAGSLSNIVKSSASELQQAKPSQLKTNASLASSIQNIVKSSAPGVDATNPQSDVILSRISSILNPDATLEQKRLSQVSAKPQTPSTQAPVQRFTGPNAENINQSRVNAPLTKSVVGQINRAQAQPVFQPTTAEQLHAGQVRMENFQRSPGETFKNSALYKLYEAASDGKSPQEQYQAFQNVLDVVNPFSENFVTYDAIRGLAGAYEGITGTRIADVLLGAEPSKAGGVKEPGNILQRALLGFQRKSRTLGGFQEYSDDPEVAVAAEVNFPFIFQGGYGLLKNGIMSLSSLAEDFITYKNIRIPASDMKLAFQQLTTGNKLGASKTALDEAQRLINLNEKGIQVFKAIKEGADAKVKRDFLKWFKDFGKSKQAPTSEFTNILNEVNSTDIAKTPDNVLEDLYQRASGTFREQRLVGLRGTGDPTGRPGIEQPAPIQNPLEFPNPQPDINVVVSELNNQVSRIRSTIANRIVKTSVDLSKSLNTLVKALKEARPIRAEQEQLYTIERGQRLGNVIGVREELGGEAGFEAEKAQLKGELPKIEFESLRGKISQEDIDNLFNAIKISPLLDEWQKITAQTGLAKMFRETGGNVPTNNELELLGKVFPSDVISTLNSKRDVLQRLWAGTKEVLNLPRTLMSSYDLSAPFRQGIVMLGRPKQFIPAFTSMFKQFASEDSYNAVKKSIEENDLFPIMKDSKLAITDVGGELSEREERFMAEGLAEKIPLIGRGVRASSRAYTGFLNKLRSDVFTDIYKKAENAGVPITSDFINSLSKFINSATGRGSIKHLEPAAEVLNGAFFSPRLIASRINMLNPAFYIKLNKTVRKEALKSMFYTFAALTTILGLTDSIPGVEVGLDPRSADFGKIKIGDTRLDILGGFQQWVRLAAQLWTGEIVSSTSGKIMTLGEGYRPLTRLDILARFFGNKQNPIASYISGIISGQDALGNDFNPTQAIVDRFVPMMASDIYDLYKTGDLEKLGLTIPGILGASLQTYGPQEVVFGQDQLGNEAVQIRPITGLSEDIMTALFGEDILGSTTSTSAERFHQQLKDMPAEQARQIFDKINEINPDVAKKIIEAKKNEELGITPEDLALKSKGVANGDRALAIQAKFDSLETDEERRLLWDDLVKKNVLTEDVATQLKNLRQDISIATTPGSSKTTNSKEIQSVIDTLKK